MGVLVDQTAIDTVEISYFDADAVAIAVAADAASALASANSAVAAAATLVDAYSWRGEYDVGTTYDPNDLIIFNSATWIALQETTGNPPPNAPATANANWELFAGAADFKQIQEAAEIAQNLAEDAASNSIAARDAAASSASNAATSASNAAAYASGFLRFNTRVLAQAYQPTDEPDHIETLGYFAPGDYGGGLYRKVASEPSHPGKISITKAGGGTLWYELASDRVTIQQFGGGHDRTPTENINALFYADQAAKALKVDLELWAPGVIEIAGRHIVSSGLTVRGRGCDAEITGTDAQTRVRCSTDSSYVFTLSAASTLSGMNILGNSGVSYGGVELQGDRASISNVYCHDLAGSSRRAFSIERGNNNMNNFRIERCGAVDCEGTGLAIEPLATPTDPAGTVTYSSGLTVAASAYVKDEVSGLIYQASEAHTTSEATMAAERAAYPGRYRLYQFAFGECNANAGIVDQFDALRCGTGVVVGNAFDNEMSGLVIQNCTDAGLVIRNNAAGNRIVTYLESNGPSGSLDLSIEATAGSNEIETSALANIVTTDVSADWQDRPINRLHTRIDDGKQVRLAYNFNNLYNPDTIHETHFIGAGAATAYHVSTTLTSGATVRKVDMRKADGSSVQTATETHDYLHLGLRTVDDNAVAGWSFKRDGIGRAVVPNAGDAAFSFAVAGGATAGVLTVNSTTVSLNSTSDRRAKENIVDVDSEGWADLIARLGVYRYTFKANGEAGIGPIAQDVAKIFPEAVTEQDGVLMLDYAKLVVPLLLAVADLAKSTK